MRILLLSPRPCWPTVSGAKLRDYHLIRALGERAEVVHFYFAPPGQTPPAAPLPESVRAVAIPAPARYTAGKILRSLALRRPLPVLNYYSPEMDAAIARELAAARFDAAHLESLHMSGYLPALRRSGLPVTLDWHNIESEGMRRYAAQARSLPHKLFALHTAGGLERVERELLSGLAGHLVCSERERARLAAVCPTARLAVVENGVDSRAFAPPAGNAARTRLVFVGSMDYHANIGAALEFARQAWPEIHRRRPQWRFTLVGSNPVPAVRALAAEPGIEVTGTVEDVRPYYHEAVASLAPLRTGGGTRLKILEAMAAGAPVVSTALGAEGLAARPGEHYLLAGTPAEWVAQLDSLAPAEGGLSPRWHELSRAGLELARTRYDWGVITAPLFATLQGWAEPRP
jgi:polysaccharide biosynthesis protein PslH